MESVSKLRCRREGGACLQRGLAGALQHFEDLVLGRLSNALDEGQEAARSRGFGQAGRLQLLHLSLPVFEKLRENTEERSSSVSHYNTNIHSICLFVQLFMSRFVLMIRIFIH